MNFYLVPLCFCFAFWWGKIKYAWKWGKIQRECVGLAVWTQSFAWSHSCGLTFSGQQRDQINKDWDNEQPLKHTLILCVGSTGTRRRKGIWSWEVRSKAKTQQLLSCWLRKIIFRKIIWKVSKGQKKNSIKAVLKGGWVWMSCSRLRISQPASSRNKRTVGSVITPIEDLHRNLHRAKVKF